MPGCKLEKVQFALLPLYQWRVRSVRIKKELEDYLMNYGEKANEIAKKGFAELLEAQYNADRAAAKCKLHPEKHGFVSAEDAAKISRAKADRDEANARVEVARKKLTGEVREQIAAMREPLVKDVQRRFAADPAKVDPAAMELLKSGIMTSRDFSIMMDTALSEGNVTMARLVSRYAADAAQRRIDDKTIGRDSETVALLGVSSKGVGLDGSEIVDAFDSFLYTFDRCCVNTGMLSAWEEMTAGMVARF